MFRYLTEYGITVAKSGSTFTEIDYPSYDELADYDKWWLGGYEHIVSDEDGAALAAAGYNAVPVL